MSISGISFHKKILNFIVKSLDKGIGNIDNKIADSHVISAEN